MKKDEELITNLKEIIKIINSEYTENKRFSEKSLLSETRDLLELSKLNTDKWGNDA